MGQTVPAHGGQLGPSDGPVPPFMVAYDNLITSFG